MFVFGKESAPEGLASFQRIGDDLFVVWIRSIFSRTFICRRH